MTNKQEDDTYLTVIISITCDHSITRHLLYTMILLYVKKNCLLLVICLFLICYFEGIAIELPFILI